MMEFSDGDINVKMKYAALINKIDAQIIKLMIILISVFYSQYRHKKLCLICMHLQTHVTDNK